MLALLPVGLGKNNTDVEAMFALDARLLPFLKIEGMYFLNFTFDSAGSWAWKLLELACLIVLRA